MSKRPIAGVALAGLLAAVAVTAGSAQATYIRPGLAERLSVSSSGAQANGPSPNSDWYGTAMTPDGRFVAFTSKATNLTPDTPKRILDTDQMVFVRDRLRRTTTLASVLPADLTDKDANTVCQDFSAPAISDDGRYVAFDSTCTFVVQPPKFLPIVGGGVFVRDLKAGTTTLVSVGTHGEAAAGGSGSPTISANGRFVAFESTATNLVNSTCAGDPYAQANCAATGVKAADYQVYVRDLARKTTVLASAATDGGRGNGASHGPSISPDGRYVEFSSVASDLVPGDTNVCNPAYGVLSCPDVFLRDLKTNRTELISVGLDGKPANDESGFNESGERQAISADDRYVVFISNATNLVPNHTNNEGIFVRDRMTGRTERVDVDSFGKPSEAQRFSISRDGRYIALSTLVGLGLCPDINPGLVGVHDQVTGGRDLIGWTTYTGAPNDCKQYYNVSTAQVSQGGRCVSFATTATNLVRGDTNKVSDVFLTDRGAALGVGGLARSGALAFAGASAFRTTGVVDAVDPTGEVSAADVDLGLDLRAATVAYRAATADLFVKLELNRMPLYALASPAVVYTVDLAVHGTRYELRVGKTATGPSFALYRADGVSWTRVGDVNGGYGTTGEEVVAAVPLAALGAAHGGHVSQVSATSGFGTVATGVIDPIDGLTL